VTREEALIAPTLTTVGGRVVFGAEK